MTKPELSGMTNRDAIQHGFHNVWTTKYTIDAELVKNMNLDTFEYEQYCTTGIIFTSMEDGKELKTIPLKQFKANASFDISGTYNGEGLGLEFSTPQKDFLTQHGRLVFKANSGFLEEMIFQTNYEGDGSIPDGGGDEWATNYSKL